MAAVAHETTRYIWSREYYEVVLFVVVSSLTWCTNYLIYFNRYIQSNLLREGRRDKGETAVRIVRAKFTTFYNKPTSGGKT